MKKILVIEWPDGSTLDSSNSEHVEFIEEYTENGMHSDIPYIRVRYKDGRTLEVSKHHLVGVMYAPETEDDQA